MRIPSGALDRRRFLQSLAILGGGAALADLLPAWARTAQAGERSPAALSGEDIRLTIGHTSITVDGRASHAVTINGTVPGPLIRLKEGQTVRLHVSNGLEEETSIHWHGLLVPFEMDGVPGVSFPGIKPGETFVYEFKVKQSGSFWYHSHSGLQEQVGHYGPMIIDPAGEDPAAFDREHVVVLSDHTRVHPHQIFRRLKQQSGAFNFQRQTIAGLLKGRDQTLAERLEWGRMLMDPTDISDVTGAAYTFLINGRGPKDNWTGLFAPGERVRLRFINAAAQSVFNVRIPGLKLTVVAADGQHVRPVEVDEFQIGNAETYDVIVRPVEDKAFTIVSESVDRSGLGRATLAPRLGMTAEVPPVRARPLANMRDMGMDMGGMDHGDMDMSMRNPDTAPQVPLGPGVQMLSPMAVDRTGEPGQGLANAGHRVLVYRDLVALEPNPDQRAPERSIEIHLTGNMERFMWGFDGRKFSDRPPPYAFRHGERVRVVLVNDTMMAHPIHLHGHYFELAFGPAGHMPRKHTVIVLPGGRVAFDFTAETGDWAFHCHMLYHMHAGMFQVFSVRDGQGEGAR
ncbi:copper resistance system multicopper oxidase [Caulobacter radicis]|uniref:copper resistance system multicopper oxidase n=1 Tax=Caulobacter radicis TaxID=2172650 RepID=UPI000D581F36|nr:copper resistance system multicopper oxidase [Caulobacter radicis]PVM90859.1 copper resistance system multicopper oxidase [Caulobacter radicis]